MPTPRPRVPKDPTLRSTLELLLLFEAMQAQLWKEAGNWRNEALLLSAELPDPLLIGRDHARLLVVTPGKLQSLEPWELLTRFPHATPIVRLQGPMARWDSVGGGGVGARLRGLDTPRDRARGAEVVRLGLARVRKFRKQTDLALAALGDVPAARRCLICSPLNALSWDPRIAEWPADTAQVRSRFLTILGAPLFHDRGSREGCLKRCPLCATHYLWKSDYAYFVNGGTEDESSLTALTPEEAAPWEARVAARVREVAGG